MNRVLVGSLVSLLCACGTGVESAGAEGAASSSEALFGLPPIVVVAPAVVRVPSEAATVQAAVDRVRNGGLVEVSPGVYREAVVVAGKRVRIIGVQQGVVLEAPQSSTVGAVVRYGSGGGGELRNVTVRGGGYGVKGQPDVRIGPGGVVTTLAPPAAVLVDQVDFQGSGTGLGGVFGVVQVYRSTFTGITGTAVATRDTQWLQLWRATITAPGASGVSTLNTRWVNVQESTITDAGSRGVQVRDAYSALLDSCGISGAVWANAELRDVVQAFVWDSTLTSARGTRLQQGLMGGYGLLGVHAALVLDGNTFASNASAGVGFGSCTTAPTSAELSNNTFGCNAGDIFLYGSLVDGSGVTCTSDITLRDVQVGGVSSNHCSAATSVPACLDGSGTCHAREESLTPLPFP